MDGLASQVFTMDRRSHGTETGYVAQMLTLFDEPGFEELVKPGDVVAIKVHCGEWNNTAYLRPVYARAVADRVKELGGRPFVCDTTTLTYGPYAARSIAPDLMVTAERNGYNSSTLGCPFLVADGYNGTDDIRIPLPEGYILREAFVAKAIALADSMIVLTHFKGHPMGVIGGSVKNLGIGAQSKRGKYNVHMGGHPTYGLHATVDFNPENATPEILDMIPDLCPHEAYSRTNGTLEWDRAKCNSCLGCLGVMASSGVWSWPEENFRAFNAAVADGCLATLKALDGKVGFLNMALDVSPRCDCVDHADVPITPHLGIFSGWDPVALDKACRDRRLRTGMSRAAETTSSRWRRHSYRVRVRKSSSTPASKSGLDRSSTTWSTWSRRAPGPSSSSRPIGGLLALSTVACTRRKIRFRKIGSTVKGLTALSTRISTRSRGRQYPRFNLATGRAA